MKTRLLYRNFLVILGIDVLLLATAWYGAHLLRFNFEIPVGHLSVMLKAFPIIIAVKIITFYFLDLYRGMWRYTSIADLLNIIKASSISSLIIVSFVLFGTRFKGFSRSVFVIDWCLTILVISGFRLSIRLYFELIKEDKPWRIVAGTLFGPLRQKHADCKNLLIIGAGDCGEKIYREIRDYARLG